MNREQIIALFKSYTANGPLAEVVKLAIECIERSKSFKLGGDEASPPHPASHYFKIYELRLKIIRDRRQKPNPGLEETVELFNRQDGRLRLFHVLIDDSYLIFFWLNERNQLEGCIITRNEEKIT